jgi:hypothetical protein
MSDLEWRRQKGRVNTTTSVINMNISMREIEEGWRKRCNERDVNTCGLQDFHSTENMQRVR